MPAATEPGQLRIGDLVIGKGGPAQYLLLSADIMELPAMVVGDHFVAQRHGTYITTKDIYRGRTVTFEILIRAANGFTVGQARDDLMTEIYAREDYELIDTHIWFPNEIESECLLGRYRAAVFPEASETVSGGYMRCTLRLDTTHPYRQSSIEYTRVLVPGSVATDGWEYPRSYPGGWAYAAAPQGILSCDNEGSFDTYPIIVVGGPATDPEITNETLDEKIKLWMTLRSTDILTIDTYTRTIKLNDGADRYSQFSRDSTFWSLKPGSNTIRFKTSIYDPASTVTVKWRNARL